jgi:hypothetical protein
MPRAKWHNGSGWTDLAISGAVDYAGERITYGPPTGGGTVDEFFTFATPGQPDWPDDPVNVGVRFAVLEAGEWIGNRVWRPITVDIPPGGESVFGHNDNTGVRIAEPTPIATTDRGMFVDQLFSASTPVVPGVDYVAGYYCRRYGFTLTANATLPFTTTRLYTDTTMTQVSFYNYGSAGTRPGASSPNFHFNISPIVRFPA